MLIEGSLIIMLLPEETCCMLLARLFFTISFRHILYTLETEGQAISHNQHINAVMVANNVISQ